MRPEPRILGSLSECGLWDRQRAITRRIGIANKKRTKKRKKNRRRKKHINKSATPHWRVFICRAGMYQIHILNTRIKATATALYSAYSSIHIIYTFNMMKRSARRAKKKRICFLLFFVFLDLFLFIISFGLPRSTVLNQLYFMHVIRVCILYKYMRECDEHFFISSSSSAVQFADFVCFFLLHFLMGFYQWRFCRVVAAIVPCDEMSFELLSFVRSTRNERRTKNKIIK